MGMPVMNIGEMHVAVSELRMPVQMGMRLTRRVFRAVPVLVVFVVYVAVCMLQRLVDVQVVVPFGQMKPRARGQQSSGCKQRRRHRLPPEEHRGCSTYEGRQGKVGPGSGGSEVPKRQDVENEAHPVAGKADSHGDCRKSSRGPGITQRQGDAGIDAPRHQAFDGCDLHRIPGGDLLGEVVVDGPAQRRGANRKGPYHPSPLQPATP